jgi:hypothetical protein
LLSSLGKKAVEEKFIGRAGTASKSGLGAQFAQKFLFVHSVLECLAAVNENDGYFVGVEAANLRVGVDIDFTPGESAAFLKLDETFFDDFTQMTSLAGINNDFPRLRHSTECSSFGAGFPIAVGPRIEARG